MGIQIRAKPRDSRATLASAVTLRSQHKQVPFSALYPLLQDRSRFAPPVALNHTSHDGADVLKLHVVRNVGSDGRRNCLFDCPLELFEVVSTDVVDKRPGSSAQTPFRSGRPKTRGCMSVMCHC